MQLIERVQRFASKPINLAAIGLIVGAGACSEDERSTVKFPDCSKDPQTRV